MSDMQTVQIWSAGGPVHPSLRPALEPAPDPVAQRRAWDAFIEALVHRHGELSRIVETLDALGWEEGAPGRGDLIAEARRWLSMEMNAGEVSDFLGMGLTAPEQAALVFDVWECLDDEGRDLAFAAQQRLLEINPRADPVELLVHCANEVTRLNGRGETWEELMESIGEEIGPFQPSATPPEPDAEPRPALNLLSSQFPTPLLPGPSSAGHGMGGR